ncbi:MAG: alpha/beta hydrolase [Deltaproteobacteria bacterium]|nr:MAG: alpha/beta hydrolase [Deltaproteobacteria bacterium]
MASSNQSTFSFPSDDGTALWVHRWLPDGPPKAIVQIVHGMAEHGGRYGGLAEALCAAGYGAYAHDQRGHGRSVPEGEELGHMADSAGWDRGVSDIHLLNRHLAHEHGALPLLLLGHSMGSLMLQQVLAQHPEDGCGFALSGTSGSPPAIATAGRLVARIERARLGKRGKSGLLNALSFGDFNKAFRPTRTDFDWLSRDEAEVDAYIADPLCGVQVSTQCWVDLLDALPKLTTRANLARIPKQKPIFLMSGSRDPVGDMGKSVTQLMDAYRNAWLTDVEMKLYDDGRHEILHETNHSEVTERLVAWFDRVVEQTAE